MRQASTPVGAGTKAGVHTVWCKCGIAVEQRTTNLNARTPHVCACALLNCGGPGKARAADKRCSILWQTASLEHHHGPGGAQVDQGAPAERREDNDGGEVLCAEWKHAGAGGHTASENFMCI